MVFNAFGMTAMEPSEEMSLPQTVTLFSPYPNPFNARMRLAYFLPSPAEVTIRIYDLMGRTILRERIPQGDTGYRRWDWNVDPDLASGIYIVQLQTPDKTFNRKVTYLK